MVQIILIIHKFTLLQILIKFSLLSCPSSQLYIKLILQKTAVWVNNIAAFSRNEATVGGKQEGGFAISWKVNPWQEKIQQCLLTLLIRNHEIAWARANCQAWHEERILQTDPFCRVHVRGNNLRVHQKQRGKCQKHYEHSSQAPLSGSSIFRGSQIEGQQATSLLLSHCLVWFLVLQIFSFSIYITP